MMAGMILAGRARRRPRNAAAQERCSGGRKASGAPETGTEAQQRSDADRACNEVVEGLAPSPELSERNLRAIRRVGGNHWRAAAQAAGGGKE